MPEPAPPLVFAAEIVLVLALSAGAGALFLGIPLDAPRERWRELARPYLDRQRDLAQSLGLRLRTWLLLRLLCAGAGLAAGALTGALTLALGGAALGLFGLPLLPAGRPAAAWARSGRWPASWSRSAT